MSRKHFIFILAFLLVLALMIMAEPGDRLEFTKAESVQYAQSPSARGPCTLSYTDGILNGWFQGFSAGMQNISYYDPATCPSLPAYPFEITDFSFTLYDWGDGTVQWPVTVDVVVYDMAVQGDSCSGPGAELCRVSVTCDSATFCFPNAGMVIFPTPCCVTGPFYAGIEYTNPGVGAFPSVVYDDQAPPATCINWFYYSGVWYKWADIWADPIPGYPMFWINGETNSANCGCFWKPGDPHKMHFPQLPNEAGWDVNATQPMILADDFMCMKSGPITDFHFWGGWKGDVEGQIIEFVLSIHADIPADPPSIPYSRPGPTLWEWEVFDFTATQYDPPSLEGWYDPATGEVLPDNQAHYWQYDICLDPTNPDLFVQDSGRIYWLNISAIVADPQGTTWGWKSTNDHWNDDAVWATWGNLNWIDIWEPAEEQVNPFYITIDPTGAFLGGGGGGAYGDGWYWYPEENWWNIWFYDHPYDSTRKKYGFIQFDAFPFDPGLPMELEVAVNWATDLWSIDFPDAGPPMPGADETMYIGRTSLFFSQQFEGHYGPFWYEIPDYNPEWVSVDVRGYNFDIIGGDLMHACQGSLDLAFVITGEVPVEDSGACCYDPTGGPPGVCIYTTQTQCEQILGGVYEGTGIQCQGDEACCLPSGACVMADALCCTNELGGTPQGPGSTCQPLEACCFSDGTCQNLDPQCCTQLGGTPQGAGSVCGPVQACCMSDGSCQMLDSLCCIDIGGIPQGTGSNCQGTVACCFPDGTCQTVTRVCCDDMGGIPSPFGAPMCLGDMNGDGFDDACVIREDLKWRQLPDLNPTGIDVAATCPSMSHECIVLAEDFLCTENGLITEIHIYGSWYGDQFPGDPGNVTFVLSIHDDVPAGIDQPWSHPRSMFWTETFVPGQFDVRPYGVDLVEGYYDPIMQFYEPVGDYSCWEYIFYLQEPFLQEGTEIDPIVYWLDVQAYPETESYFGWKTSRDHWNDDGVWSIGMEPIDPLQWVELVYPFGHPFELESIDLAFEIYGIPQICDCIPGDANNDGGINVGDAVYIIAYVFKGGPPPAPYPICSGDANCDCQCNVGDAVYLISYVFKGGPPPCDCLTWLSICGPPLRK